LQPLQAEIRVNTQRILHRSQDVQDLSEDLATLPHTAALEPQLESLSDAVAEYRHQRELLGCAGDLAGAAVTINRGLEQQEQSE
jgi:hypothetical protein